MKIVIIDGQGGNLGRQLTKMTLERYPEADVQVIGTNSAATTNMLKAGAVQGATGENAVIVAARRADVIMGPIGIVIADALMGEVTPQMAVAVGQSDAVRILLPMNRCETLVAGMKEVPTGALIEDAMALLARVMQ